MVDLFILEFCMFCITSSHYFIFLNHKKAIQKRKLKQKDTER